MSFSYGGAGSRWAQAEDDRQDFSDRLVTLLEPAGTTAEAYRTLRTSLLYTVAVDPPKVVVLTSPGPQEGKSTTCANLGVVLAQADKKVLVVDCDLRKPVVHKIFGLRNVQGVVNVLVGERDLQEVWQDSIPGLKVVTVGPIPPNPAELLGSKRFAKFLERAREEFDYVLLDAPPMEPVSDPTIVASQGDGALLVIDAQKTRKAAVRRSMRSLKAVGANVLGTVMNNAKVSGKRGYYKQAY